MEILESVKQREIVTSLQAELDRLKIDRDEWKELAQTNAQEIKAWRKRDPLETERQLAAAEVRLEALRKAATATVEGLRAIAQLGWPQEAQHDLNSMADDLETALGKGEDGD
jgi:hypothetical protein